MPYNPNRKKPIEQLTAFEIAVRELRAAGLSEADMYRGLREVLTRNTPTRKDLHDALELSGADPRKYLYSVNAEGKRVRTKNPDYVTDTHQLFKYVPDWEDLNSGARSDEFHPAWVTARRVGQTPKYPTYRDDRKREAAFERKGIKPPGTVARLIRNQVIGHIFRTAEFSHKYEVINTQVSEQLLKRWEETQFADLSH